MNWEDYLTTNLEQTFDSHQICCSATLDIRFSFKVEPVNLFLRSKSSIYLIVSVATNPISPIAPEFFRPKVNQHYVINNFQSGFYRGELPDDDIETLPLLKN